MNRRDQEIQDIVNQLERLQIQQSDLVQRLGLLSDGDNNNNNATRQTSPRDFAVGDKVRISNPGRLQPVRGTIIKIGRSRITVEARDGTKIVRAPRNLVLET
jgi:transcription antitermination factor NusG